jgi:hypothetical protein
MAENKATEGFKKCVFRGKDKVVESSMASSESAGPAMDRGLANSRDEAAKRVQIEFP